MATMRSAHFGILSILSCLMLGTFFNAVHSSPPAAVANSQNGDHPLQVLLCKTVDFKLRTIIYADGVRDSSSSTQTNPGPYKDVLDGSASSSNSPLNTDSAESGPLNPTSCKAACKKAVQRHRDLLAIMPDRCQVVITDEISPAYTRPGYQPSTYDWAYIRIRWEDLSVITSCLAPGVIDALAFDTEGTHQEKTRRRFCTEPDFTDHHQCMCRTDLRVRRLLPEAFQDPDYGLFRKDGKGPCREDNVISRLVHNGWQPYGHQFVEWKPCLQKDDADWVPTEKGIM
ncbi:hypothetical protein BCR37DRAFT_388771 [Protomyces lactucae-debilis]|uniref:Uncharacterized protein n=1 Tax=Protomyces lactucae-debilis TaxID=2754530 RepID=A0A1Y2F6M7_PROLT|nr:uncharacterized protein BCR37DRAFT_388771 [Protomyces lactucae-debilis]ORY78585.1 hypothetical protein BCR37DRAFT_388771 [Protomyces lactucae-debilis]